MTVLRFDLPRFDRIHFTRSLAGMGFGLFACLASGQQFDGGSFQSPSVQSTANRALPGNDANADGAARRTGVDGAISPGMEPQRREQAVRASSELLAEKNTGRTKPLPEPSEFQKYVETATGRLLPVFGARFFAEAPSSTTQSNVPVNADYVVAPGDELMIRAWGSIDVDYRTTVDRNGLINLPKVGSFNVAGVKASALESHLRAQIGRIFTNFNLNVTLGQLRGVNVFVVGPAATPGAYNLPSQATLLSAVAAAGGPAPSGSMRKVSLRRDGRVITELDIYEFLVQGDKSRDLQLLSGDVVVFQPAGARVALTGATETAAIFELKAVQEPLGELLRYAGGASVLANRNRVNLERIDPTQLRAKRFVEEFQLDANGLQKIVRDGDVLTMLAISPEFANAVTLKGHVAQPLRSPWRPGMRIRDLIPDKDALISPDFYRRKNMLVQVVNDDEAKGRRDRDERLSNEERNGSGAQRSSAGGFDNRTGKATGIPSNASSATEPKGSKTNSSTAAYTDGSRSMPSDDPASAARTHRPPTALFDDLNWDYAAIERLNQADLTTRIIPFSLGRAVLQGDDTQNLELLPGDVVTVFSQKDLRVPVARQTRLVSLEGEVGAPGVYQLQPGDTLRSLIARAGGFTPQAYVYGLDFSREETRQRQRENLASASARLEALAATQAARTAANRRDEVSASADAAVSTAATQAQLTRLARIQPNGRIALELDPNRASLETLPDVPLDHADRITVPTRPGFVTVSGAVVNNNAFLWKPGRSAGDYVKVAGLDEGAEIDNMFILRADGTVTHANDKRGVFGIGGGLQSQAMYPGDAIVVPNQLDYETWGRALVRNLKDWSQIFSQFGLGAAAIQTLRN